MTRERAQTYLENGIYLIIWAIVILMPVLNYDYMHFRIFRWTIVYHSWIKMCPFILLFLLNNYFLFPLLVRKYHKWMYYVLTLLTIVCLMFVSFHVLMKDHVSPELMDMRRLYHQDFDQQEKDQRLWRFGRQEIDNQSLHPLSDMDERFPKRGGMDKFNEFRDEPSPRGFWEPHPLFVPFWGNAMLALLILGCNIAVKLLFKSVRDERQLKEMEKENLRTQLVNLKDQINPHFFMNTLNNIHALIDVDTEQAKEVLIELSKLMRYVLYESNSEKLPLKRELDFLRSYVALMSIRYTDELDLKLDIPEDVPDVLIPPMLSVSFVENAFKHGVSYQHPSFIHISIKPGVDNVYFSVLNSCFKETVKEEGGIGIENTRKRLDLIYKENYSLDIVKKDNQFSVILIIPFET